MYFSCKTKRPDKLCVFWKKGKGHEQGHCTFIGGQCKKIIEACLQCKYVEKSTAGNVKDDYCLVYMDPSAQWALGKCSMYVNPEEVRKQEEEQKKMKNPLKASRRKAKGRSFI
jgi:hypothetical protein